MEPGRFDALSPAPCPRLTALLRHLLQLRGVPRLAAVCGDVHADDALPAAAPGVPLDCNRVVVKGAGRLGFQRISG